MMQENQQAEQPESIVLVSESVNSCSSPDKKTFSSSYHLMACLLTSVFSYSAIAVESLDDLLSLSLQQLSQVQIEVASKRLEGINDAPSVVTVMTAEEIQMFGGKDLYEVLGRFVGVQTNWRAEGIGRVQVRIRNDQPSGSDYRHTLILLNGSPFNMDSYNGNIWNQAALAALPLEAIARIELIRGPGSVLHGTTAFQGVINIVTKEDVDEDGFQDQIITVSRGSRDSESYRAQLLYGRGDFALSAYAMGLNSAGERLKGFSSSLTNPYFNESMHEDSFGLLADIRYRELKATIWYGSSDQGSGRRNAASGRMDESDIFNQRYFANVSYPIHLSDTWDLEVKAVSSGFRNDLEVVAEGPSILYESDEQSLELNLSGALSQQTRLLTGMVATHYSGDTPGAIQPIPEGWDYLWWSVYSQIDYRPRENIKFTLGGQYNKAEKNSRFVPRAGVVINFTESWGMKLLYGEAFRSPVVAEVGVSIPSLNLFSNPVLKPELVATTDLQLFYQRDNAQAAISVFHSKQKDLSVRVAMPVEGEMGLPLSTFQNEGSLTIEGIELEGKITFAENWFITAGLTFQRNEDAMGREDFTLEPDWEGRFGIGFSVPAYNFGLYDIFRDDSSASLLRHPSANLLLNPTADSYHLISANANIALDALFSGRLLEGVSLGLHIENLLDKEIYVPSVFVGGFNANTVPSRGGRTLWVQLKIPL